MSLALAAFLLAVAAEPARPAPPTTVAPVTATAESTPAAKPKPDEVVCKREPVLGSRMKQRVCQTQADWDQQKQEARAAIERAQTIQPAPR